MKLEEIMPSLKELVEYSYSEIKNPQYDLFISQYLKNTQSSRSPSFVQVSGIPGSGKSTFIEKHNFKSHLYIAFDKIMTSLDGYQQDLQQLGAKAAFQKWEMPARVIGYKILEQAISNKLNIVLEHSGTNFAHVELFKKLPTLGYKAEINFTLCNIDIACKRAAEREKSSQRHTPKELIEQRHSSLNKFLNIYQKLAEVKIYNSYDSGFKLRKNGLKQPLVFK